MTVIQTSRYVVLENKGLVCTITFNNPQRKNVINPDFLNEFHGALDDAERNDACRLIVMQGSGGYFCTGMDFDKATEAKRDDGDKNLQNARYMQLLKRIADSPKVTLAKVEGKVMAGGIGIVVASDVVVSDMTSEFSLPEALWGLLPACVTPFLIRRVGVHQAYRMVLTTETLSAEEAKRINLIDVLHSNPAVVVRQQLMRICRLTDKTTLELKDYFRRMWIFNEAMEQTAIEEINRLVNDPVVQDNIRNYAEHKQFPWDRQRRAVPL